MRATMLFFSPLKYPQRYLLENPKEMNLSGLRVATATYRPQASLLDEVSLLVPWHCIWDSEQL